MIIPPINKNNESINKKEPKPSNIRKSYTQVSKSNISPNIENVLQIKNAFPSLSASKAGKMMKAMNGSEGKKKSSINMTTREPSRKQVIVPMVKSNAELIVQSVHQHITNINNCLRNIKSDVIADFLRVSNNGVNITMCYKLRSLGLDNRTTLILSNIRELDRELFYKLVYLI